MHLFRSVRRPFAETRVAMPMLAALIMLGGCISGGVDGPPIDDTGSIDLAVSQPSATIAVGMPAVSAVTVTRLEGYQGSVVLTADSLPTGVTVSFEPSALIGAATTSIMTITAAPTAVVALDTINVRAAGVNVGIDSLKVEVRVAAGSLALKTPNPQTTSGFQVTQGTIGSIPVVIERSNGFAGAVNLVVEGLPANVTATFTPALLPNGTVSSTLLLSAAANAVPGGYNVVLRARGQGVPDQTARITLFIADGTQPDFSVSAAPAAFGVVAGTTVQSVITISRIGGFAGPITFLNAIGAPPGLTATISPETPTSNTSTLTVATTAATVPGTYIISFGASTNGALMLRPFGVAVTVTPPPGIKVVVAPSPLRIAPGGFTQAAVLITRVAGFTGDFVMSAENLPAGLTASFSPAPVTGTATTLTLAATAVTAPGTYNIVVKATAGSDFGTFTVPVTVATSALRQ